MHAVARLGGAIVLTAALMLVAACRLGFRCRPRRLPIRSQRYNPAD